MGFVVKYEITRCGWDGEISRSFTEYYKTKKGASLAIARIEKEYSKGELTSLEVVSNNLGFKE